MSARIAPEPIGMGTTVVGEYRSRTNVSIRPAPVDSASQNTIEPKPLSDEVAATEARDASEEIVVAEPALPPGAMFAAAVVAGALPPYPETPEELLLRIGQSWTPPDSELRLRDRVV